jgi:hypothetical protein
MPITYPSTFSGCAPKTAFLSDYFGKQVPENRDLGSLAFLQWLLSSENRSGVRQLSDDILGVPGKKRGVKMQFTQPLCVSVCSTVWNCADPKAPLSPAIAFADFDIQSQYHVCTPGGAPASLKFTSSEWAQYCELNDEQFIQDQFSKFDMAFFKALDKTMVELLRTLVPAANDVTFPFLRTNTTTGNSVLADEWLLWITEKLSDEGTDIMDVVLFGGRMVNTIKHKYKVSTASSEGFNLGATRGDIPNLYYDRNFDSVFGANTLIAIPKNALQLVIFNEYVGGKRHIGELAINSTKTMPLGNGSSITFDYQWRKDIECLAYEYFPSIWMELVKTIPGGCAGATADGFIVFKDCTPNALPAC